jgi:CubicO group peptidase (beta-lactamase class C family)
MRLHDLAFFIALSVLTLIECSIVRAANDLPEVKPEAVGISSERLRRIDAVMQKEVNDQTFAGIVTMAARHGKVFQSKAYGQRDLGSGAPMEKDTIFRIFSMSKPVTGVAMMILYEEGKWSPQDPISKYIPEFAHLKVFKGLDAAGNMVLEDPVHPPTIRELMTHTAGFSYGAGDSPVDKLYQNQNHRDGQFRNAVLGSSSLQEMIERLAKIPLLYQPGSRFVYSVSVDIQGYLVEKLSGKPFPQFLKERIFDPLRMKDTGLWVPPEKLNRFASLYKGTDTGKLALAPPTIDAAIMRFDTQPVLPSGGGGLVSTAGDYLRFAQMLLNGGEFDGVRILSPESVKLMRANHLSYELTPVIDWRGMGFGFDVAVITDPALADSPCGKGTYFWSGAAGTWFWVDPTDDMVFVGMVQRLDSPPTVQEVSRQTLYQALIDLNK